MEDQVLDNLAHAHPKSKKEQHQRDTAILAIESLGSAHERIAVDSHKDQHGHHTHH